MVNAVTNENKLQNEREKWRSYRLLAANKIDTLSKIENG